ncbi:hypothetical protein [Paludisphaera borealis]|uniref:Uncharacterized protein n=1 Tax=Paludisphaera borealis TaxID=1387353 RepID=A0A1U7CM72_9BACT|nr:hypothetical protein [Paludisphaera borealis]APW60021.1 hypothetical protein BSF38_01483 [Paludisphaera borealis]
MTLRLVLVSLVAGLGITVPGWPTLEGWVASTQKWMNARLAEMDDRQSGNTHYVVIHDLLKVEMERAHLARQENRVAKALVLPVIAQEATSGAAGLADARTISLERSAHAVRNAVALLPLPLDVSAIPSDRRVDAEVVTTRRVEVPSLAPPVFEPLVVGDRLYVGTAFDLNYRNEGLGILPRTVVLPLATPAAQPADLIQLVAARYGSRGVQMARAFGRDLREVAARELAAREAAARELASREFAAMENSANLYFDDAPVVAVTVAAAPALVAELPSFDVMEKSDNLYFADSLIVDSPEPIAAEAIVETPSAEPIATAALDTLPDDPFAPADSIKTVEDNDSDLAGVAEPSDVSGKSMEPSVVATQTVHKSDAPRPEVNRAVRLTRDALYAWVNVLTGPALVTVAPSSSASR